MEPWGREERSQVIVVAALLLAVLFVGLALVLNSAIYAENIATRGETSTSDAMATGSVTEDRLQRSIHGANYYSDEAGYGDRRALIRDNVTDWDDLAGAKEARSGQVYLVEEAGMTDGTRVIQKTNGEFMPGDEDLVEAITDLTLDPLGIEGRTTWIPAPNSSTRDFQVTVDRSSLEATDQSFLVNLADITDTVLTGSNAFWIQTQRVDDADHMWRVYLVDDAANDSVAAVVTEIEGGQDGEETLRSICRAEGDSVTVDVTEGQLVGSDETTACPDLTEVSGGERNNVFFVGADKVRGTYRFMTDVRNDTFVDRVNHANSDDGLIGSLVHSLGDLTDCLLGGDCSLEPVVYEDSPNDTDPYTTTAIYDATIRTTYQDGRITYTRNVTYPPTAR